MSHEQIEDENDDLWLSGHRSIFSSDGNDQHVLSFGQSQYDGFHWDCLVERRDHYHQLTFEDSRLSEWSMRFNSNHSEEDDDETSNSTSSIEPRRTSWKDIRRRSHPCHLYHNFSDKSQTDSSISSKVLPRLITFSQLRNIDRSLQTSLCPNELPSKQSIDPPPPLRCRRDRSLPDLSFLQHYAKENPRPFASKTCQTEDNETFSSTCSSSENSTSSSGYSSSTTHPRRLKSCLKRQKSLERSSPTTEAATNVLAGGLAGDSLTLTRQTSDNKHSSMPIIPARTTKQHSHEWILSEQDLRTKKSVSFCTEIVRRMITPASSPEHRSQTFEDDCNFVPRESFNESPPNEFEFESDDADESDCQPMNFTQATPEHLPRPLAMKYPTNRFLIDAFAKTILRILEIKCNDPQSYYLNNSTNEELDRTLRFELCPLLYEVLDDGLRPYSSSLFSKKINLWRLIDSTSSNLNQYNEAKLKAQLAVPSAHDSIERFSAFVYHLLNFQQLANWFAHFLSHQTLFQTYYEASALILMHHDDDLFEQLTNQLEKLSPLSFRLKYSQRSSSTSSTTTTKKFNVRLWLRDRKTQVKLSPKQLHSHRSKCIVNAFS